jgi:hypothetical protein
VKEFLMSDRLAMSPGDISQYHISFPDAHTVLARACLGVLLRDLDDIKSADPLARYAAEHWVAHAQVEDVASRVRDGMERLFDPDKPYFEAWIQLHNIDHYGFDQGTHPEPGAGPLYYAALCGFHELVEHLILKYPQCASARGGGRGTALHSASFAGHLQIVQSLLRHGVDVDVRGDVNRTPLIVASISGHCDVVQCLIDHGADVNSHQDHHDTSLIWAAYRGHVDVVRILLKHHADVNCQGEADGTPLHNALWDSDLAKGDRFQTVRLLLEHGAGADTEDINGETPMARALELGLDDIVQLLYEFGAKGAQT